MRILVAHNAYTAILEAFELDEQFTQDKLRDNFLMQLLSRPHYFYKTSGQFIKLLLDGMSYSDFVIGLSQRDDLNKLGFHLIAAYLQCGIVIITGNTLPSTYGTSSFTERTIFLIRTSLGSFHTLGKYSFTLMSSYAYVTIRLCHFTLMIINTLMSITVTNNHDSTNAYVILFLQYHRIQWSAFWQLH